MNGQIPLPGMEPAPPNIVNVASVKHRSPFRYPGGKTWLVPRIFQWMQTKETQSVHFVEPFAGGAIIGLSVGFEKLAKRVTLAEIDPQVAAVWACIITQGQGLWLADAIESFDLTPASVEALLSQSLDDVRQQALQTIIKNRVNRGGILAAGAGRIKAGENGRGLGSRWYPQTLARRIRDLHAVRERFRFVPGDGLDLMEANRHDPQAVFFIDPPYTVAGKGPGTRLYDHSELDHERLFALAARIAGDVLLTYNHDERVLDLAKRHGLDTCVVAMKNTHHAQKSEVLIGADLSWL